MSPTPTTRRGFLAAAAAAGSALAWTPAFRVTADAQGAAACVPPPAFPPGLDLYRQAYENWAQEIVTDELWTCAPRTAAEVLTLADWARSRGWRLRAKGFSHGWAPLTVTPGTTCETRVVLVDTTQHLTALRVLGTKPGMVRVQAGASMDVLLAELERHGLGFTNVPAPGDLSIGGVLAVDAHGSSVRARGERRAAGQTYGSMSNRVVWLTAVVWDPRRRRYVLRTFRRSHPHCAALLTHLGRSFITEVCLRAEANTNLRCVSDLTIPVSELFAAPADAPPGSRTFASFMEQAGRVEAIWFPYTDKPWMKSWTVSPQKPPESREVTEPYNYAFSDNIPVELSELANDGTAGAPQSAPVVGQIAYATSVAGLEATDTADIWGPSKNLLLYIKPSTLRATANGYVVLCRRSDVQRIVAEFTAFYAERLDAYRQADRYPVTVGVEIRVTGLDHASHVGIKRARSPALSALHPRRDRPEWDTGVWLDVLTAARQPDAQPFFREIEDWIFERYDGTTAEARPEWSKGWAYSGSAAWADAERLGRTIPALHRRKRRADESWDWAVRTLDTLDPHRVFSNAFLDRLLVARRRPRA